MGSPRLQSPLHSSPVALHSLTSSLINLPSLAVNQKGLQAWAIAQKISLCFLLSIEGQLGFILPANSVWPLDFWQEAYHLCHGWLAICPLRERLIWKVPMDANLGEILIQEPSFDQEGVLRLRGNLSCLRTSGALKSLGRLCGPGSLVFKKGPNRMRPGWKLHIIGTQRAGSNNTRKNS